MENLTPYTKRLPNPPQPLLMWVWKDKSLSLPRALDLHSPRTIPCTFLFVIDPPLLGKSARERERAPKSHSKVKFGSWGPWPGKTAEQITNDDDATASVGGATIERKPFRLDRFVKNYIKNSDWAGVRPEKMVGEGGEGGTQTHKQVKLSFSRPRGLRRFMTIRMMGLTRRDASVCL